MLRLQVGIHLATWRYSNVLVVLFQTGNNLAPLVVSLLIKSNRKETFVKKLVRGVHRFKAEVFSQHQESFERLAQRQSPEVLFITCSDSRIDPSLITQTEPGELFVLRNAGNIVPPHGSSQGGEEATIEYAVTALGVKHIVVCGHSHCGAMKGLLAPESLASLPNVEKWLSHAQATWQRIKDNDYDGDEESHLATAIEQNVLVQLDNLRTIPAVNARLAKQAIELHGWVYVIETGDVHTYDAATARFTPLVPSWLAPKPKLEQMVSHSN